MTLIKVSRGATEVEFRAWQEGPGQVAAAIDLGKPFQNIREKSGDIPRVQDSFGAVETFTALGILEGSTAYADAKSLAEDLIRPHSNGVALQVDATALEGINEVLEVGVIGAKALELDYRSGHRERVDLALSLPIVSSTVG